MEWVPPGYLELGVRHVYLLQGQTGVKYLDEKD